jgi:hypothetical protein
MRADVMHGDAREDDDDGTALEGMPNEDNGNLQQVHANAYCTDQTGHR